MGSTFKRNQGHSTVEMCLVASLVACACIGAVILVAGGFNDSLSVVKSDLSNRARAAKIQSMMAPVYVSDPSIYDANGGKALLVNERVCVGATGNICVEVPQMSAQMLSETSGGMGAQLTEELSMSLQQIAEMLAHDPNVDPSLVAAISELANLGHMLADHENAAVSLCKPGSKCEEHVYSSLIEKLKRVEQVLSEFQGKTSDITAAMQGNTTISTAIQMLIQKEAANIEAIAKGYSSDLVAKDTTEKTTTTLVEETDSTLMAGSTVYTPAPDSSLYTNCQPDSTMGAGYYRCQFTDEVDRPQLTEKQTKTLMTEVSWGLSEHANLTDISANNICSNGGDASCQRQVDNPDSNKSNQAP